jgi:NAD(P)-dependent dehydrogenase (short-subunit alcohol dehydrogenase family)
MSGRWTSENVPGQQGRVAVVTGANTGLGFEIAQVLAGRGASVVLAVRNPEKGKEAAARIGAAQRRGDVPAQADHS